MIVSQAVYIGFVTAMVLFVCTFTSIREGILLAKLLRRGVSTPEDRDRRFGHIMGLAACALGYLGIINYYWL